MKIQIFRLLRRILGGRYFASLEFPVPFILLHGALKCTMKHGFRTSKHDLRIRPIYHWTPRPDSGAHCNLLYMAFYCVQCLCHRLRVLGHLMSVKSMRRQLNALQFSVLVKSATDEKYAMPSRASAQAKRIYRSVSLSWNESPFRLRVVVKPSALASVYGGKLRKFDRTIVRKLKSNKKCSAPFEIRVNNINHL